MNKIINSEKPCRPNFTGFIDNYKKFGYEKIIRRDIGICPDLIMLRNGKEIRLELETKASHFLAHKHSFDSVDEIICVHKDIELKKPTIEVEELIFEPLRTKVTLSLDSETYKRFQKFCGNNDIALSKRIDRLINNELKDKLRGDPNDII
jgi:hypothetical protein